MPRAQNPGREHILKRHGKRIRKRTHTPSDLQLTVDEIERLRLPEIPIELWRNGEALFGQKMQRLTSKQVVKSAGRDLTRNPATQKIIADKAKLRRVIANDLQLVKDFEFFTRLLGWDPEGLLQFLYWDCDMMHASRQAIVARDKREYWPIERESLERLCDDISELALRLEELNKTNCSPARTVVLRTADGVPLPRKQQRYFLTAFRGLPEILGSYRRDLRRKILNTVQFWSRHTHNWKSIIESAREGSLYEKIRGRDGQYHAVRLHRLVNAARRVHALPPLELRAFVIWLNRFRARREKSKALSTLPNRPVNS